MDPRKDVDRLSPGQSRPVSVAGRPRFVPCTPKGILRLLEHYDLPTAGKRVAVVGRSVIVGRPVSLLLSLKGAFGDATVTMPFRRRGNWRRSLRHAR
ncbi:MAG: bifunctional 5,10-methylenetetrahydrofolate dehydrogenase/5,10-methenyltetrahydrofolate cyclohydrolase [bacterium]|nr:bifunctional 5,10-methylenetetrahydrofolate dehydrogenase/5,10-methenyltetrahydrofolate cyclohydrolase [bacterium]